MSFYNFLLIFALLFNIKAYAALDCKKINSEDMHRYVEKNYKYEDVSYYIDWLKQCDSSNPKLLSETDADNYKQIGLEVEAEFLFDQASAVSYYGNSKIELDLYLNFIQKHNLKYNQVKHENSVEEIRTRQKENKTTSPTDCKDINLKDQFPNVRNQDSIGWCYAFVAADMMSFKAGFKVSAIDIAVNYTDTERVSHSKRKIYQGEMHDDVEGGLIDKAGNIALKKGLCKESDSPSEYFAENNDIGDFIKSVEDPFSKIYSQPSFLDSGKKAPVCFSKESSSFIDIYKVLNHSQPNNIMYQINEERCQGKRQLVDTDKYSLEVLKGTEEELIKSLHKELNSKSPAAIRYHPAFLKGKRKPGNHASTVVGRRFNNEMKSCEFLIRNSWGSDCKAYSPQYADPSNCNNGHIWVSEANLHQIIYGLIKYKN